ncbi:MAG: hypothetical protein ACRDI1_09800 [Actinomycetota bacterium]
MSKGVGGDGRLTARNDGGERARFGIGARGRWIVMVAVVSATVGMFLVLGGTLGLLLRAALGSNVLFVVGAAGGGIVGAGLGAWLALGLADFDRTRRRLIAAAVGGVVGLLVGMIIPLTLARRFAVWPVILAMLAPGAGAAGLTALFLRGER